MADKKIETKIEGPIEDAPVIDIPTPVAPRVYDHGTGAFA